MQENSYDQLTNLPEALARIDTVFSKATSGSSAFDSQLKYLLKLLTFYSEASYGNIYDTTVKLENSLPFLNIAQFKSQADFNKIVDAFIKDLKSSKIILINKESSTNLVAGSEGEVYYNTTSKLLYLYKDNKYISIGGYRTDTIYIKLFEDTKGIYLFIGGQLVNILKELGNLVLVDTVLEATNYPNKEEGQLFYVKETENYYKFDGQDGLTDPFPNKLNIPTKIGEDGLEYLIPAYYDGETYWRSATNFGKVDTVNEVSPDGNRNVNITLNDVLKKGNTSEESIKLFNQEDESILISEKNIIRDRNLKKFPADSTGMPIIETIETISNNNTLLKKVELLNENYSEEDEEYGRTWSSIENTYYGSNSSLKFIDISEFNQEEYTETKLSSYRGFDYTNSIEKSYTSLNTSLSFLKNDELNKPIYHSELDSEKLLIKGIELEDSKIRREVGVGTNPFTSSFGIKPSTWFLEENSTDLTNLQQIVMYNVDGIYSYSSLYGSSTQNPITNFHIKLPKVPTENEENYVVDFRLKSGTVAYVDDIDTSFNNISNSLDNEIIERTRVDDLKMDKPIINNTNQYVLLADGSTAAKGDLGKNFANSDLVVSSNRKHTGTASVEFGFPFICSNSSVRYSGLLDKSADATFNQLLGSDSNGNMAKVGLNAVTNAMSKSTDAEKDAWRIANRKSTETYSIGQPRVDTILPPVIDNTKDYIQYTTLVGLNLFFNNSSPSTALVKIIRYKDINNNLVPKTIVDITNYQVYQTNTSILSFGIRYDSLLTGYYKVEVTHNGLINIGSSDILVTTQVTNNPIILDSWKTYTPFEPNNLIVTNTSLKKTYGGVIRGSTVIEQQVKHFIIKKEDVLSGFRLNFVYKLTPAGTELGNVMARSSITFGLGYDQNINNTVVPDILISFIRGVLSLRLTSSMQPLSSLPLIYEIDLVVKNSLATVIVTLKNTGKVTTETFSFEQRNQQMYFYSTFLGSNPDTPAQISGSTQELLFQSTYQSF